MAESEDKGMKEQRVYAIYFANSETILARSVDVEGPDTLEDLPSFANNPNWNWITLEYSAIAGIHINMAKNGFLDFTLDLLSRVDGYRSQKRITFSGEYLIEWEEEDYEDTNDS